MNRLVLSFILVLAACLPAFAWNKNKAILMIQEAQSMIQDIDSDYELKEYIPFDEYSEAIISIRSAQIEYDKENYPRSYFYAAISIVKIETTKIMATTRKLRYEKLVYECDFYKKNSKNGSKISSSLLTSGLVYDENTFRKVIADRYLFSGKNNSVSASGRKQLDPVIAVMKEYPAAKIKIVGHTSFFDNRHYSLKKAETATDYLANNGIEKDRIEAIGLGNAVVLDTALGYRRVDVIEIIITGIELTKPETAP